MKRVNMCLCKSKLYKTRISSGKSTVLNNSINQNILSLIKRMKRINNYVNLTGI